MGDVESEILNLRTAVESSQRGLSQLEAKIQSKLELACRRQVEDVMAAQGPIVEFRQSLSKVQSMSQRLATELSNVPHARDVSSFLEKHQETLESRVGERIAVLEDTLTRQIQGSLERLDRHGSETWRSCLQRMANLEEKVVLQSDIVRIVDRTLAEVRKAGPDLFGAGAVTGPAAIGEIRKEMRRGEAKVAGLEARLLGLAEDSSSEGRIWRASMASKVDSLESAMQDQMGRLAGNEAKWAELQESFDQNLEVAQNAAVRAEQMATKASLGAQEVAKELIAEAKDALHDRMKAFEEQGRAQRADLDAELQEFQRRLNIQDNDLKRSREKSSQVDLEFSQLTNRLSAVRIEVSGLKDRADAQESQALHREGAENELARRLRDLQLEVEVQGETLRRTQEDLQKSLARAQHQALPPGESAFSVFAAAVRQPALPSSHAQPARPVPPALASPAAAASAASAADTPQAVSLAPSKASVRSDRPGSDGGSVKASLGHEMNPLEATGQPRRLSEASSVASNRPQVPSASHLDVPKAPSVAPVDVPKVPSAYPAEVPKAPAASPVEVPKASDASPVGVPKAHHVTTPVVTPKATSSPSQSAPSSARQASTSAPPEVIRFRSPNWQKECDGTYDLLKDKTANGQPIWKKRGGDRWLYLNTDRNWGVGGKTEFDKNFDCKNSFIFHPRTPKVNAVSPEKLPPGWMLFDGKAWREDPQVTLEVETPPGATSSRDSEVPSQRSIAPPAQPQVPAAAEHVTGIAPPAGTGPPGTSRTGSAQTPNASVASSARSQMDGGTLADQILAKMTVEGAETENWDEGSISQMDKEALQDASHQDKSLPRPIGPPAGMGQGRSPPPPISPAAGASLHEDRPSPPPVRPGQEAAEAARRAAMAEMGFDSDSAGGGSVQPPDPMMDGSREVLGDLGLDEGSDWDD